MRDSGQTAGIVKEYDMMMMIIITMIMMIVITVITMIIVRMLIFI